jgi:hypothetical protein
MLPFDGEMLPFDGEMLPFDGEMLPLQKGNMWITFYYNHNF